MSCLGLLCFLHGLTVRMYRLSPVPVSLVSFPIFPTAPSHSPLLGKVNGPKHSSPFLMMAHCFTIDSNALTFLGRLFFAFLFYCEYKSHSPEQRFYSCAFVDVCMPTKHTLVSSDPRLFCLLVFLCVSLPFSHPVFVF